MRGRGLAGPQRMTGFDLLGRHETALDQVLLHPQRPAPVVRRREIGLRRQGLLGESQIVDMPGAGIAERPLHGEHAPFPAFVKRRLVGLDLDLAEAVHAAHVVDAVHRAISAGERARPVPIIESRVTRSARRSSLQPSVPAGRIGTTRKRVSAVEVPDAYFGFLGQRDAEIGQNAARVLDRPRAVGRRLVPDRRQPEHFPRIAGAQRADDHVVALRRVLDRDQMVADGAHVAERGDRRGGILQQRLPEGGIGPRPGDDEGAVARADLGLVGLDDGIERRRIDVALLGQDRFQGADAQLRLRQLRAMLVRMVMIVVSHGQGAPVRKTPS